MIMGHNLTTPRAPLNNAYQSGFILNGGNEMMASCITVFLKDPRALWIVALVVVIALAIIKPALG